MHRIPVVPTIRFGDVAVRVGQVPLATPRARVIPWRLFRVHPELRHESASHIVISEVATNAELLHLHFVCAAGFRRSIERMVVGLIEVRM